MQLVVQTKVHNVPFLARGNAPHTMQLVQYRLQACQNRTIKLNRERAFQPRFMLCLLEQILQLEELDLQMQLPILFKKSLKKSGWAETQIEREANVSYIAMNSSTELFSFRGSSAVCSLGSSSSSSAAAFSELDATRRVYSQPMFKQNLCAWSASIEEEAQDKRDTRVSVVLSQLLAEFTAGLRGPPEPRDKARPDDTDRDGGGAVESDIDHGYIELSRVVPVT